MRTLIRITGLLLPFALLAQQDAGPITPAKTSNNGNALQSTGARIPAEITVKDNVSIEAVLLPPEISKRVFGKNISDTYAAILVNVANRSNEATLLLHSVYLDYSGWGFRGLRRNAQQNCVAPPFKASGFHRNQQLEKWQAGVSTCEVSSVEYRIVRGQMLQAQPWTLRNFAVRGLELIGTIAAGYATFGHADVARFLNAYNGVAVPALDKFWMDDTVGQLNRISDFGFRNDKAIPQQASDIIVAFFPLDRFLTPLMKKIYFQSPALFFNPIAMAIDPTVANSKYLGPLLDAAFDNKTAKDNAFKGAIKLLATAPAQPAECAAEVQNEALKKRCAEAEANQAKWELDLQNNPLLNFVQGFSLSRVQLVITGSMTVDVDTLPATISDFECTQKDAELWAVPGTKTCVIHGKYLAGGRPVFPDAETLGISDIETIEEGSGSEELRFRFKLSEPLDPPVTLRMRVTKSSAKGGRQVDSTEFTKKMSFVPAKPSIANAELNEAKDKLLLTGSNFHGGPKANLTVKLIKEGKNTPLSLEEHTATRLTVSVKDVPAGDYEVVVANAAGPSDGRKVTIPAKPEVSQPEPPKPGPAKTEPPKVAAPKSGRRTSPAK